MPLPWIHCRFCRLYDLASGALQQRGYATLFVYCSKHGEASILQDGLIQSSRVTLLLEYRGVQILAKMMTKRLLPIHVQFIFSSKTETMLLTP
jgi:hypothetical protein